MTDAHCTSPNHICDFISFLKIPCQDKYPARLSWRGFKSTIVSINFVVEASSPPLSPPPLSPPLSTVHSRCGTKSANCSASPYLPQSTRASKRMRVLLRWSGCLADHVTKTSKRTSLGFTWRFSMRPTIGVGKSKRVVKDRQSDPTKIEISC